VAQGIEIPDIWRIKGGKGHGELAAYLRSVYREAVLSFLLPSTSAFV
jgi:hypothetical protein